MATFTSTSGSYTTTLTVTQTSQSTQNNQSTLTYSLTLTKNSGTGLWNNNSCPWSITIDGSTVASGSFTYDFRSYSSLTLKGSTTTTVTHNSDGTKTVACSASVNMDNEPYVYVMKPSGDLALTTIPRASDVSVSNYSIANTSGSISATITSKARFYHKWRWRMNSGSWSSWTNKGLIASTSSTVTVANTTLLAQLPTATSGSFNIEVQTYSDSGYANLVGTKSATCTVSVNTSNIKPSISLGNIAINSSPISGYAVAGYSSVKSTATTTNSSGASSFTNYFTVSSGSLTSSTSTSASTTVKTNTVPSSSSNYTLTIYAYAKDSRGAVSSTVSKSITVYGYQPPTATLNAYRVASSSSTSEDGAGTYAYVTFSGAVRSSVNSQNSIQSTKCTYSGSISGTATNGGHYALADTQTVTFQLTVTDKVTSVTTSKTINTATYPLDLYDNGSGSVGVGLGTVAQGGFVKIGAGIHTKGNWFTTNNITKSDLNQTEEGVVYFNTSTSNRPCDYGVCYTLGLDGDNASTTWYSQIAFGTNGIIYFRNSINSLGQTWRAWQVFYGAFNPQTTIANADNATNASNANIANATYRNIVSRIGNNYNSDFAGDRMRVYEYTSEAPNKPFNAYCHVFNTMGSDTNYATQLALGMTARGMYYRPYVNSSWLPWGKIELTYVLWTGTLLGGNSITLSGAKAYQRLRVYAKMLTTLFMIWEVDTQQITTVTKNFNHGELAYISDPGDHYITMAEVQMTQSGQNIVVNFVNAKNVRVGTSGSNTLNNNSNYAIYRIDGII